MEKTWSDFNRIDLKMIPVMIKHGFSVKFDEWDKYYDRITPENPPHNVVEFIKDTLCIWKIYKSNWVHDMDYEWMSADLINGFYTHHKPILKLEDLYK